jgi:K+-sensing histidine kinase KdpD
VTLDDEARAKLEHDVRAPLAVIAGYAEAIVVLGDDETCREGAKHIQAAVDRLGAGIDALLEAMRVTPDGGQRASEEPR